MESLQKTMSLISTILDIDQNLNGQLYLEKFVENVANNLNVKYALIGHPIDNKLDEIITDAVWADDQIVDNFKYKLKDTPCEIVLSGERVCIHDSNVCIDFPEDLLLQEMKIEAYVGAPVISKNNSLVSGILVLLDDKPMKDKEFFTVITEFLALRAAAEIDKDNYTKKLLENEKKLIELNNLSQSLANSQEVLLSLFDKGESTLFRWENNEKWDVEYVSKGVNKILGYNKEAFINNDIAYSDCIHKADLHRVEIEVKQAIEKNLDYFSHEPYRITTKDGIEKWVLDHTATQKDKNNNITHFIGYITDITEQIKSQEMMFAQSKIASLGEMLGNIAHQWRQPLSVISTAATGTKVKKEYGLLSDEDFYKNMDSINDTAQYLSHTIDDFRNFFLADTSTEIEVNLENVINKVISLINDSYQSSNIKIIKNYQKNSYVSTCNENLFIQALINILNNAKDALNSLRSTDCKFVFINLEKIHNEIQLEIKDNANGIPTNIINKIFDPYFTTKHSTQGTGIGLYMTNQIVTKHLKAKITVSNTEYMYQNVKYKGASFKIKM